MLAGPLADYTRFLQIQRDLLHGRYMPGEHSILEILLAWYFGYSKLWKGREFVLCEQSLQPCSDCAS